MSTITSRENWLRFLRGEKPEWMPVYSEVQTILPLCVPENIARGFVKEAGSIPQSQFGGPDMYGVPWVFEASAGGSIEDPSIPPILTDVADWREVIHFPDIDLWDWEGAVRRNQGFLAPDRLTSTVIYTGFFERLISFMGFEGAAMALIDEDCAEDLHALLQAIADTNIELIAAYKKHFDIDHIFFHDDWGAQMAPFFSLDTCREMLVPYMKRVVDFCHANDIFFEFHCCGRNDALAPAMVEAGVDAWCGQPMCDKFALWDHYGDKMAIGIAFSAGSDEELFRQVDAMVEHIKSDPIRRRMYVRDRVLGLTLNLKEYLKEKTAPLYK